MKNVLIIGGGFAGAQCALILNKSLPENYKLYLFDKKDFFQFTPSIHKIITNYRYEKKIVVPYKHFLKKTKIITEEVTKVTKKEVKAGKKTYSFDYLVICSGAQVINPFNNNNIFILKTIEDARKLYDAVQVAKNITIIGGGYTGSEVAGELITKTNKKINIIEKHNRLLCRQNIFASTDAYNYLTKKGVKIYFEQEISKFQSGFIYTTKREKIPTDIIIWCAGIKPNLSFLGAELKNKKNEKGQLLTTPTLNLQGYKNIFVGGDITSFEEEKSAQNAEYHGKIIAENILRSIKKKKLLKYTPKPRIMIISLGDYYSIYTSNNIAWGSFLPAILKKLIEKKTIWKYKYAYNKFFNNSKLYEEKNQQKTKKNHQEVVKNRKFFKLSFLARIYEHFKKNINSYKNKFRQRNTYARKKKRKIRSNNNKRRRRNTNPKKKYKKRSSKRKPKR